MANITLNFSSRWPSIQVHRVLGYPDTEGESSTSSPHDVKVAHILGYPPLAIGYASTDGVMRGVDVDESHIYYNTGIFDYIVIYSLDISAAFEYPYLDSEVGTVLEDTSGGAIDLRKFLLHSRAVSPMVLTVSIKDYSATDLTMTYTSPLSYATFSFGYVRSAYAPLGIGIWYYAPLSGQAWPVMSTDGFTSVLQTTTDVDSNLIADKGSIITLRNPAIITDNSVDVTI